MIDGQIKEIFNFNSNDVIKSHFSKRDLEKIIRVYNICQESRTNSALKTLCRNQYAMIIEETAKQIRNFSEGNVTISADAISLMESFIETFGRNYQRVGKEMKYQYTADAYRAKLLLAKAKYQYYQQSHIQTEKVSASTTHVECKVERNAAAQKRVSVSQYTEKAEKKQTVKESTKRNNVSTSRVFIMANPSTKHSLKSSFWRKLKETSGNLNYKTVRGIRRYGLVLATLWGMGGNAGVSGAGTHMTLKMKKDKIVAMSAGDYQINANKNIEQDSARAKTVKFEELKAVKLHIPQAKPMASLKINHEWDKLKQENIETSAVKRLNTDNVNSETKVIVPYDGEYTAVVMKNQHDYKDFIADLVQQFQDNISQLKNPKVDKNRFYSAQEELIAKYGKSKHIVRNKSCESMSFATFLSVYEKNNRENNFVAQACRELLLQVPNPHACISNKKTFEASNTSNLRKSLKEKLKGNKYGVYMLWTRNPEGGLHRQTVIGTGDGNAYLLAFNNNRIARMSIDNLDKVTGNGGFYCDLGAKICDEANVMAVLNHDRNKLNDNNLQFNYALAMNSSNARY